MLEFFNRASRVSCVGRNTFPFNSSLLLQGLRLDPRLRTAGMTTKAISSFYCSCSKTFNDPSLKCQNKNNERNSHND